MTLFEPEGFDSPAAPSGPLVRVRLEVAYDGSRFHGFAVNPGVRTVGGTLGKAIQRVLGHTAVMTCAGRTDTGVHARGQVVSFDAEADGLDVAGLQRAVNKLCSPDVVVRSADVVDASFDARRSAVARRYRYQVLNSPVPDPFLAKTAWHVEAPIDIAVMRLGCDPLLGEHDFSSFCRRPKPDVSLVRRVIDAGWEEAGAGLVWFWIEANAFCHQMVRALVGTLIDVGLGRKTAADVGIILRARNRAGTGNLAPPHGLCLWSVRY